MQLLAHIGERFLYRIYSFLHHWYAGSFRNIFHATIIALEQVDRKIAIKISVKHLFVPMYGDKSITGHILGFIFRLIRIAIGLIAYLAIVFLAIAIYLAWATLPALIVAWGLSLNL
ncbi:MAG: hypothetical protein Q8Q32_03375 [bacterium]|nr:hypothetical protein [bacterium]